jgi:PAS domain S-box-containing protein
MRPAPIRLTAPDDFAPLGSALAALGIGVTLIDREMRIQYANELVHDEASELSCGRDHCFAALWRREGRCADCLPLLVFRTGEAAEGVRERGLPGAPREAWRVRAIPIHDRAGQLGWVAETFLRLASIAPGLAGRGLAGPPGAPAVVVDREERIVSWSPAAAEAFGYTVEQALGRRIDLIVPEERRAEEGELAARVAAEGRMRIETVRRARDGRLVPVALTAVALRDEAGALVGRTCVFEDQSVLHQLRGRVEAQERLLAHISREAADAIVGVGPRGDVTSWNHGAEQLLGLPEQDAVGGPLSRVAPEGPLARMLEQALRRQAVRGVRMTWRDVRGEPVPVEVSAAALGGAEAGGVALVARDLSAQLRLERQFLRSEKLAMAGSLAAGLAHEIGTPLSVICATAEYLMLDGPEEARAQLKGIVAETDRISRLVRELLSLGRGASTGRQPVALDAALERALSLLRFTLEKKRIAVERDVPDGLPPVHADPDGLHQVLLNLLVNAAHAVPEGGRVAVRARSTDQDGSTAVIVEVDDDGPGVPLELRERIFDPFFTTRADGTGLGLAVCARIVADYGGDLRVGQGRLGGASFVVSLPAAGPEEEA